MSHFLAADEQDLHRMCLWLDEVTAEMTLELSKPQGIRARRWTETNIDRADAVFERIYRDGPDTFVHLLYRLAVERRRLAEAGVEFDVDHPLPDVQLLRVPDSVPWKIASISMRDGVPVRIGLQHPVSDHIVDLVLAP